MTTTTMDEILDDPQSSPGARLASIRLQQGYTAEYVAGKLHLRVRIIELLEADDYHLLPEPVFIKGYLRAYAKLLGVAADPLVELFHQLYKPARVSEKTLWQGRRETNRAEHAIRWLTGFFALVVVIAVTMWWYTNKDNQRLFPASVIHAEASSNKSETEIRLTDLSKMRSILSSPGQLDSLEKESG
ncbi:MAG: helix-turn-helix domain-containing protein [Legionellales bacterium]|nr:helix-turn-helix domain-containing protein [Legionellales bacterium]